MQRFIIIVIGLFFSSVILAQSTYQIDLILFAQLADATASADLSADAPLIPMKYNAIRLKPAAGKPIKPYTLLPNSYSSLRDQYYLLSKRSPYPVLAHYSWRQPANSQDKVALPFIEYKGWQVQGTIKINHIGYYALDAELQASPPSNPQSSFIVSQKQRLKGNSIYYLDNERIGIIIKIHRV